MTSPGTQPSDPTQQPGSAQPASSAAAKAHERNCTVVTLPLMGEVSLPAPQHLAWYAGVGLLAVAGIVEWPIAVVLAVGKALSDNSRNNALRQFGEALDEGL